jgi:hypothetical protein
MDDELLESTRKFLEELEDALKNSNCSKELKPIIRGNTNENFDC